MKFQLSTKPLADALNQCIINANVSKFYSKSCLVQLTASGSNLSIITEASNIRSKAVLKGSSDSSETANIFVDSLQLKQLISTIDASAVTLEFAETGLIIHAGKSTFTLAKMIDDAEMTLIEPEMPDMSVASIAVDKSGWKFIKDHQLYALAMSFLHPVYTRVYMGSNGDVIVGDYDNSLFTYSKKGNLSSTSLLSDTIVNLFVSLPDGATLTPIADGSYLIKIKTDSFEMATQFFPQTEESFGSYNAETLLSMSVHPETDVIKLSTAVLHKFLGQADLLSTSNEDTLDFCVSADSKVLELKDSKVNFRTELVENTVAKSYTVKFKTCHLKSLITSYADEFIWIAPLFQEGEVVGIVVWDKELTTVLGCVV